MSAIKPYAAVNFQICSCDHWEIPHISGWSLWYT